MKDLAVQMADLDDFVTRARAENEGHHSRHTESMTKLSATVGESFSNISSHYKDTFSRVESLRDDMETDVEQLQGDLEPLQDNLCQPLGKLRQDISNTNLHEYEPTGETPEKIKYQYPTQLPRTASHEALVAAMHDPVCHSPSRPTTTPGKRTPAPQVFNDFDDTERARSPSRPTSSDSGQMTRNPLSCSLREMNANMTTSVLMFDPSASTSSAMPPMDENTVPIVKKSRIPAKGNHQGHPTKKLRLDGVENMPPNELGQSTQRRKSARLQ